MSNQSNLLQKIETRSARIGVIGLGYVGLPLATRAGRVGFSVLGFDVSANKIASLNAGVSYIGDISSPEVADLRERGRLEATSDFARLRDCDIAIICVPTPLNNTRDPDISFIESAADAVARELHAGQLVILESTTYPGTTQEVIQPRMESGGLKVGADVFLAFSPERIDPGQTNSKGY